MLRPIPSVYVKNLLDFKGRIFFKLGKNARLGDPKEEHSGKEVVILQSGFNGDWYVQTKETHFHRFYAQAGQLKVERAVELGDFL